MIQFQNREDGTEVPASKIFKEENRLVVREFIEGGKIRLEMFIDGDGLEGPDDEQASTSLAVVGALFSLWTDGTVMERMRTMFGFMPGMVEIRLENIENGDIPGSA